MKSNVDIYPGAQFYRVYGFTDGLPANILTVISVQRQVGYVVVTCDYHLYSVSMDYLKDSSWEIIDDTL